KLGSDGISNRVDNCTGGTCTGYLNAIDCTSGESIPLHIGSSSGVQSTDDAKNPLAGELSTTLICDEYAPAEQKTLSNATGGETGSLFSVTYPNQARYPLPKQGDTLVINLVVSEDETRVEAMANLTSLTGNNNTVEGTCEPEESKDAYNCTWTVRNILPGNHELAFDLSDGVDHEAEVTVPLSVDEVDEASLEETPKFFRDTEAEQGAPGGYNRVALGLAEKAKPSFQFPMFATYTRQLASGYQSSDIEVLSSTIDGDCQAEYPDGEKVATSFFNDFSIRNEYPRNTPDRQDNAIDIGFSGNPNTLPDSMTVHCNVTAYIRDASRDVVYRNPTSFTVSIPFSFRNSALGDVAPGERYSEKIRDAQTKISKHRSYLETIQKWYEVLNGICTATQKLKQLKVFGSSQEGTGSILEESRIPGVGQVGKILKEVGEKLFDVTDRITGSQKDSYVQKATNTVCRFTTCSLVNEKGSGDSSTSEESSGPADTDGESSDGGSPLNFGTSKPDWASKLESATQSSDGDLSFGQGVGQSLMDDLTTNVGMPNPEESAISAITTLCLPGMVHHYANYISMKCQKLICMKQAALQGLSISSCEKMESRYICSNIFDELMEVIGPARVIDDLANNADSMLQTAMPTALNAVLDNSLCKDTGGDLTGKFTEKLKIFLCHIPKSFQEIVDIKHQMTPSQFNFDFQPSVDTCNYALCDIQQDPDKCQDEYHMYSPSGDKAGFGGMMDAASRSEGDLSLDMFGYSRCNEIDDPALKSECMDIEKMTPDNLDETTKFGGYDSADQYAKHTIGKQVLEKNEKDDGYDDLSPEEAYDKWKRDNGGESVEDSFGIDENELKDEYETYQTALDPVSPGSGFFSEYESEEDYVESRMSDFSCDNPEDSSSCVAEKFAKEAELRKKYITEKEEARMEAFEKIRDEDVEKIYNEYCEDSDIEGCESLEKFKEEGYEQYQDVKKKREQQAINSAIKFGVDLGVKFLVQQTQIDQYAMTGNLFPKASAFISENLDTGTWAEKACSMSVDRSKGGSQGNDGTVIQCEEGLCMPVLSMAGERFELDENTAEDFGATYVYTFSFHVGNMKEPHAGAQEPIFELYFDGKKKSYMQMGDSTEITIPYTGELVRIQHSFKSNKTYNKLCADFQAPFPPGRANGKDMFCRDLVKSSTGDSAFDTGSRAPADYLDPEGQATSGNQEPQFTMEE
ncbi:MAG: hypothetical protein ACOCZV_00610, partial [Nanoarchaeota archaeon]